MILGCTKMGLFCEGGHVPRWEARRGAPRSSAFSVLAAHACVLADGCLTKLHILPLSFGGQGPSGQRLARRSAVFYSYGCLSIPTGARWDVRGGLFINGARPVGWAGGRSAAEGGRPPWGGAAARSIAAWPENRPSAASSL